MKSLLWMSFIATHKILKNVIHQVSPSADYIILIKPQFEGEKNQIPQGGVITDQTTITYFIPSITRLSHIGLNKVDTCKSPIKGTRNQNISFG